METAGGNIESILNLDPPLHKKAWHQMKGRYKAVADCLPTPAQLTTERIMADRVMLYHHVPPLGDNIPIFADTFPVDDSVTT